MIDLTLPELVGRRAKDYGLDTPEQLAEAMGMSENHARRIMAGKYENIGIEARRALVRALDLDPDVIERSVRTG